MILRQATQSDYARLHALFSELVGTIPVIDGPQGQARFAEILNHPGTEIIVADVAGQPVSTATLHVMPNMTFGGRPYALIENVVTLKAHQGRGLGQAVMKHAADQAWAANCYKIMLLTGTALGARGFYEKLGYDGDSKHAMILRRAPQRQPLL
ncbi:GNAT family N-acetyltransferase [Phaeobacter sp. NW0010-22]|uniref:GNAT family N-acetyltransferase n=1 Tax=Phaeobacter sp. NW0010-22 TaxID=3135907 RepID=UPI0013E01E26